MKITTCDAKDCGKKIVGRSGASLRVRHASPIGNIYEQVADLDLCTDHANALEDTITNLLGKVFLTEA